MIEPGNIMHCYVICKLRRHDRTVILSSRFDLGITVKLGIYAIFLADNISIECLL